MMVPVEMPSPERLLAGPPEPPDGIPGTPELELEMERFVADLPQATTRPHPSTPPSAKRARVEPPSPTAPGELQPPMQPAVPLPAAPQSPQQPAVQQHPRLPAAPQPPSEPGASTLLQLPGAPHPPSEPAAPQLPRQAFKLENTAQTIHGALAGLEGFVGLSDKKKGKPIDDARHPYLGQQGTRDEQVAESLRWMQWSKLRAWSACRVTSVGAPCSLCVSRVTSNLTKTAAARVFSQDWQQLPTTCKVVLVTSPVTPFAAGDRIQVQWKRGRPKFITVAPPHLQPGEKFQALVPAAQCVSCPLPPP